jgi:hypothetical protein
VAESILEVVVENIGRREEGPSGLQSQEKEDLYIIIIIIIIIIIGITEFSNLHVYAKYHC